MFLIDIFQHGSLNHLKSYSNKKGIEFVLIVDANFRADEKVWLL